MENLLKKQAERLSSGIYHELKQAKKFADEAGNYIKRRLQWDVEYIEDIVEEAFVKLVDKSHLEALQFGPPFLHEPNYEAGDVIFFRDAAMQKNVIKKSPLKSLR